MAVTKNKFGATITVGSANYHTYRTWGLIMTSPDPVGDPELETNYLQIPGRPNLLDWTEAQTGEPVFKGRPLDMVFAIKGDPDAWSTKVSQIRNMIEGKQVRIRFDDDTSHYWLGRIQLKDTDRLARLGRMHLYAYCDAYKKDLCSSQEKLKWDDMNFLTDCLRYLGQIQITDSGTVTIPKGIGSRGVVPVITVANLSGSLTMHSNKPNKTYTLLSGRNRFPDLKVCGSSDITLTFTGTAKVTIDYRGESL